MAKCQRNPTVSIVFIFKSILGGLCSGTLKKYHDTEGKTDICCCFCHISAALHVRGSKCGRTEVAQP